MKQCVFDVQTGELHRLSLREVEEQAFQRVMGDWRRRYQWMVDRFKA